MWSRRFTGHEQNDGMNPERDRVEGDLFRAAIAGEKPMLCICREAEILNATRAGRGSAPAGCV